MKLIELSKKGTVNKGKYFAMVDNDIFEEVNQYDWSYNDGYAVRYDFSTGKKKDILLHRFIYELKKGNIPEDKEVEHWDENGLNDQISNLRLATRSENQCNRTKLKNNTSGIKGISKKVSKGHCRKDGTYKEYTYWQAQIRKDKKTYGKSFEYTEQGFEQAKEWIKQKTEELHKEFSIYNKPKK